MNALEGVQSLPFAVRCVGGRVLWCGALWTALAGSAVCARAQEVSIAGTPQQTNERILNLSKSVKSSTHDYVIGNGDLLDISVFDVPELTRELRVSQSGTIGLPLVPVRLQVAGLTELQAEQKIAEVLEANGLVSHPDVAVMVKEHKSKPITIVGAVAHPMVYEADRPVTLLEALAEAGGVAPDAGDTVIVAHPHAAAFVEISEPSPIVDQAAPGAGEPPSLDALTPNHAPEASQKTSAPPANSTAFPSAKEMEHAAPPAAETVAANPSSPLPASVVTINLNELLEVGDTKNNIYLQSGDVVTVPHAGIVYVLGAVTRPGGFVISNDRMQMTTLKVLSLAGGYTKIAKLGQAVIIRNDGQGNQTRTDVDLKKILQHQSEDIQMHASDILYIPDDRTKEALLQAAQLGVAIGTAVAIYRLAYH